MKKYYLAYGSNLNIRQMALRCPTAKPVGTAVIEDYELLFKGSKPSLWQYPPDNSGLIVDLDSRSKNASLAQGLLSLDARW